MMRLLLTAVLATLLLAVPARAEMEVGMQDDLTIVHNYNDRALALKQFKAMGGTHVRINLGHSLKPKDQRKTGADATLHDLALYDGAVDAVLDAGLTPQLTLVWTGRPNIGRTGKWMQNVARHFRRRVERFSIFNEPDLYLQTPGACEAKGKARFVKRYPKLIITRKGKQRAVDATVPGGMNVKRACLREERGRLYRQYVKVAAPAIRRGAPGAEVLAGETSPIVGLAWFLKTAKPRTMNVDGWAHHPFQYYNLDPKKQGRAWGISRTKQVKRLIGQPLYFTEFGYPHPNSSMDKRVLGRRATPGQVARALPEAWKIARNANVKQMLQYQWYVKPKFRKEFWETALLDKDNGKTTPAYRALRRYIRSW